MFEGAEKILVIKLRHIGDVLLTVPAIRALRETFSSASITALVNSGTEDMLTLNPLLDEVICFDRSIKGLSVAGRAGGELKALKRLRDRGFDMAVDLTGGDRPALLCFLSGAKYRLGYEPRGGFAGKKYLYTHTARKPEGRNHTVLRDLGLLEAFGIRTDDLSVDIHTSPEDDSFVCGILKENGLGDGAPFIHVHPTSRWLFKCWTDSGMAYCLDELEGRGIRTVVTTGPDERELKKAGAIISLMKKRPVDLSGRIRLKHLAVLSRKAGLFFGVDSAPMHIAAASGAAVVGVFGPSGAFDWGPWDNGAARGWAASIGGRGAGSPYPLKNGVQSFGGNTVVQLGWDCVPCGKDGCGGSKRSDCLERLEPEAVLQVILKTAEARSKLTGMGGGGQE